MLKVHVIDSLYPHPRNAAHAVEVPPGARLLFTNGQTGTKPDGSTPKSTEDQAIVAFERLGAILQTANMSFRGVRNVIAACTSSAHFIVHSPLPLLGATSR